MDISKIKEIVTSNSDDNTKEKLIITTLSKDKNLIPTLLKILNEERKESEELISEFNLELSRSLVALVETDIKKTTGEFIISKIKDHYHKWKDRVNCCFKFDDLP